MMIRKPMTNTEIKLFKEKIIRDYKLRYEKKKQNTAFTQFAKRLKRIIPINIALGLIAMTIFIIINGWSNFLELLLSGVIWITMISTLLSAASGKYYS